MTANLINTANKLNADVAGQTRAAADVNPVTTTSGLTATESSDNVFGSLGSILSGGVHPEAVPAVVDRSLDKATDSVRGVLGGLRPKATSVTAPGPAGSTNVAKANALGATAKAAVTDAKGGITNALNKFRRK